MNFVVKLEYVTAPWPRKKCANQISNDRDSKKKSVSTSGLFFFTHLDEIAKLAIQLSILFVLGRLWWLSSFGACIVIIEIISIVAIVTFSIHRATHNHTQAPAAGSYCEVTLRGKARTILQTT